MEEALAQRIRPLTVEGMDTDQLKDRLQVMLMPELVDDHDDGGVDVGDHDDDGFDDMDCRSTGEPTQA